MSYNELNSQSLSNMVDNQVRHIEDLANNLRNQNSDSSEITLRNLTKAKADLQVLNSMYQSAVVRESLNNSTKEIPVENHFDYTNNNISYKAQVAIIIGALAGFIAGIALPILFTVL